MVRIVATTAKIGSVALGRFRRKHLLALLAFLTLTPSFALAIPSPELVIGSVSSLSQVFAVGFAAMTGAGALIARRCGFAPKAGQSRAGAPNWLFAVLFMLAATLGALNIWQYRSQQSEELARLQATLVRPAQFDGTEIKDTDLKETSYSTQAESPLALSTDEAERLLNDADGNAPVLFFDVRETGEHRMGTLPGAQHVRFPDFLQSDIPLAGQSVVLFCHNGNRSSETCAELAARGIDCRFIAGGIEKWIVEGRDFSDKDVNTLSDLRAIPEFPNKDTLLSTSDFVNLKADENLQIVDTRYPGEFSSGHLPGAINIPIRALPTDELRRRIAALENKPTIAACYDRRSCFMSQVLALEISEAGIDFLGRYTTPWEYFDAPEPKPHVQEWLAEQQTSFWQIGVNGLAAALLWIGERSHFVLALLALSALSRIMILPIALKSERDQIVASKHANELKALKDSLKHDPARKARAVQQFYAKLGLTPLRNLVALLFLPIMMLGLSAVEQAAGVTSLPFLWTENLGQPDPAYAWPIMFTVLAGIYLHWAVAKTPRQAALCWLIGAPLMFGLVFRLSAAGNMYLCTSLTLLLLQRAYVTGAIQKLVRESLHKWQLWKVRKLLGGVAPLDHTVALTESGNKSYRLSVLKNAGLPVPDGVVIQTDALLAYDQMSGERKKSFAQMIWRMMGKKPCAVRSSAAGEDGATQSFAGVFESVLEVREGGMRAALDTVAQSFSSARAASYDAPRAAGHDGNILVQHMVDAEYAGVLFTQDPAAPGLAMVELVKGCGEDLVSGRVTPQSLRFGRYTQSAIGDGHAPIDLTPLLELGQKIEAIFGRPQDIEWVYSEGTFQIVQSRDITSLAGGNSSEQVRTDEWQRIFNDFKDADPNDVILMRDEMSEVLPRPTPLSFSLMGSLWAAGGSVDIACRQLGVNYNLPEGRPGQLTTLFGLTYVDCDLKALLALNVSNGKARQLRKEAAALVTRFREETIPALREDMVVWQAMDFTAMTQKKIVESIEQLHEKLVRDIYVEAAKINILASFTMTEAETYSKGDPDAYNRLMHPVLHHAPINLINGCAALKGKAQKRALMALMGHRATYDYELSTPRYNEAPDLLWSLLDSATPSTLRLADDLTTEPADPVDLAVTFQDLKEQAKHESLSIVAQIRRAVLALSEKTGLSDRIFQLEMDELLSLGTTDIEALKVEAQIRKDRQETLLVFAPKQASLTLRDCERLSASSPIHGLAETAVLGGTCVSGSCEVTGRVFVVHDENATAADAFSGFVDGDIIVCRMINPAWLPYVQRSGGVLSEVGGWLSHMAIVAREKGILMQVKCTGLDELRDGMMVRAGLDGSIVTIDVKGEQKRRTA